MYNNVKKIQFLDDTLKLKRQQFLNILRVFLKIAVIDVVNFYGLTCSIIRLLIHESYLNKKKIEVRMLSIWFAEESVSTESFSIVI